MLTVIRTAGDFCPLDAATQFAPMETGRAMTTSPSTSAPSCLTVLVVAVTSWQPLV